MSGRDALRARKRSRRRIRDAAILGGVSVAVIGGMMLIGGMEGRRPAEPAEPPPFQVVLFDPPPPPVTLPPAREDGGGAPAAPSVVRTPPLKAPSPPEITAAPVKALEPPPVIGLSPDPAPAPEPGFGQGGQGGGVGTGTGSGRGGGSSGPRFVAGPTLGQIRDAHPRAARSRYGRVQLSCRIRLDQRLEACRVLEERPSGAGFGAAAIQVATHFRFSPPIEDGRPVEGQGVTVSIDFGRPR